MGGVPTHLLELAGIFDIEAAAVANGDGALDDHCGLWVNLENEVDDILDVVGVEEVLLRVVVGGGGNDDEVGIAVGIASVEGGAEIELLAGEVLFDAFVLDGRDAVVDFLDFLGDYIDCNNFVVLCQKGGYAEAYVACSCNCYFHFTVVSVNGVGIAAVWCAAYCGKGNDFIGRFPFWRQFSQLRVPGRGVDVPLAVLLNIFAAGFVLLPGECY